MAQLTDTHCRYLATLRMDGDIRNYITFLDGDAFMTCWGFGEDNCGNETNLSPKGDIQREGNVVTSVKKAERAIIRFVCWILKPITAVWYRSSFWTETVGQFYGADLTVTIGQSTDTNKNGVSSSRITIDLLSMV